MLIQDILILVISIVFIYNAVRNNIDNIKDLKDRLKKIYFKFKKTDKTLGG